MDGLSRREFIEKTTALGSVVVGRESGVSRPVIAAQAAATVRPFSKRAKLRDLIHRNSLTVVPEANSIFAARLAALHGFEAIYIGGNMMSAMYLGLEDWGLINATEMIEIGSKIASGVEIPAIVDGDQMGETALNVYRNVREYEAAGISGMHIEDTRNPKHRGKGKSDLMALDEMLLRIAAAVEARTDPDFVVIARSDCMWIGEHAGDPDEAIRRGVAFANAGADALFLVSMPIGHIDRIARAIPIPLIALNAPVEQVRRTQLRIDIWGPGQMYSALMKLYETMLVEVKEHGELQCAPGRALAPETIAAVLRTKEYDGLADRWNKVHP